MRRYRLTALVALVSSFLVLPIAGRTMEEGSVQQSRCYSCAAPLCCGDFSLMVKAGLVPTLFTDPGPNWVVIPIDIPPVSTVSNTHRFSDIFHLPWTVGVELGYNTSRRGQVFLEYAFNRANDKIFRNFETDELQRYSSYETHSGYLGARYYLGSWHGFCRGPLSPYLGFKAGFVWQRGVSTSLTIADLFIFSAPYYFSEAVVSGGLQAGFEWLFCDCWSLVLQGEVVATQGPHMNENIAFPIIPNVSLPSNVFLGPVGFVLTFPVTLGLRWTF
jgi:hypothetical protein